MKSTDSRAGQGSATQFVRFIVAGAINSGLTYILYLFLLRVLPYPAAYTLSFAAGIALSLVLQGTWVFRSRITVRKAIQFPLVYVVQYLSGLALLALFVEKLRLPREFAPLLVVACTIPLTFVLTRYVFRPA
jgi:putative flippase GtrA